MRKRVLLLLSAVLMAGLSVPASAEEPCAVPADHSASNHFVTSSDGTRIAITAFRTNQAQEEHNECGRPQPVILTLHGWSGSRTKSIDGARSFLDAGYNVVSIDSRGHGESGGQALVHHPSKEVNDFRAVMDWIWDHLDYVQKDGSSERSKDIRVGAAGGSYGGGFQLMTAAFDNRLDALVPQITWNNLPQSLAPNGVIKSDWLGLLYGAGKLSVDLDRRIDEWFAESMATNRPAPDNVHSFAESSPFYWMQDIDEPTLLIQGMADTLFPLNEAVANYIGIRNNAAPVWVVGHNSGHILPGIQPTGLGAPARSGNPCLPPTLVRDFYDAFLKGDDDAEDRLEAFPHVALATEQGGCVTSGDWPVNNSSRTATFPALAVPQAGGTQLHELFTADAPTTVAGIPTFSAGAPIELDDIFFLSLVVRRADGLHVVHDQVMGARTQIASVEGTYNVDLGGVATTLQPGETLYLRIDGANEQYALNGQRRPGAAVFTNVTVDVPIVQ